MHTLALHCFKLSVIVFPIHTKGEKKIRNIDKVKSDLHVLLTFVPRSIFPIGPRLFLFIIGLLDQIKCLANGRH